MKLVFVYNAEAGLLNGMMDSVHKIVSPSSYECGLCAITHGAFTMDRRWRDYLRGLGHETVFHHRKDFNHAYPDANVALPAILAERGGKLVTLVSGQEMQALNSVNDLISALDAALAVESERP
jgi:hypothetical protein